MIFLKLNAKRNVFFLAFFLFFPITKKHNHLGLTY